MLLKYTLLSVMFFMALEGEKRGAEGDGGLVSVSKGVMVLEHTAPDGEG